MCHPADAIHKLEDEQDHDHGDGAVTPQPPPRQVSNRYAQEVLDRESPDPEIRLNHFSRYVAYRRLNKNEKLTLFPLFLKSTTLDWYECSLLAEFKTYF